MHLPPAIMLAPVLKPPAPRAQATAEELGEQLILLVGDVFLGAAAISYLGAFTGGACQLPGAPLFLYVHGKHTMGKCSPKGGHL